MRYVCITIGGSYVRLGVGRALREFPGMSLYADGTGIGDESIFERVEVGENQIALRSLLGGHLQARPDGLVLSNPAIGEWETFTEVWWPDDRISFKTAHGTFLCAERGGGGPVLANRTAAGDWEKFFYEVPPPELLPADEPAEESAPIATTLEQSRADAILRETSSHQIETQVRRLPLDP